METKEFKAESKRLLEMMIYAQGDFPARAYLQRKRRDGQAVLQVDEREYRLNAVGYGYHHRSEQGREKAYHKR